jgi:FMN reductase
MPSSFIGIAGSLSALSRTRTLVQTAVNLAAQRFGGSGQVYDLNDIGPSLGTASKLQDLAPTARSIVEKVLAADALVVASPVYKGSYTGLFKHFFDLFDPLSLVGKPVLLAATGGGDRHALVIEHQLRPLFGFFEAQSMATGVYASDADFQNGAFVPGAAATRLERAIAQFDAYFPRASAPAHQSSHAAIAAAE